MSHSLKEAWPILSLIFLLVLQVFESDVVVLHEYQLFNDLGCILVYAILRSPTSVFVADCRLNTPEFL